MQQVAEGIEITLLPGKPQARGAFVLKLNREVLRSVEQAMRLLETPKAILTLYPGIMRELCYWLLTGPSGTQMSEMMIAANGHNQRVIQTIKTLRDKLHETIRVADLAVAAHMSQVTFHRQFKLVKEMTPLQYQKQLRLHEGRRLMIFRNATVESAALEVGYASVSQFRREYARMFGSSPRRDASAWRRSRP